MNKQRIIGLKDVESFNNIKNEHPYKAYSSLEVKEIVAKYFLSGNFIRKEFINRGILIPKREGKGVSYKMRNTDLTYLEINNIVNAARKAQQEYLVGLGRQKKVTINLTTDKILSKAKNVDETYLINKLVDKKDFLNKEQLLKLANILVEKGFIVYQKL